MARINIEDKLFKDHRWFDLLIKTQSADTALGALVRAFTVAQRFWVPEHPKGMSNEDWFAGAKKGIPLDEWKKQRLNDAIIESGLATIRDGCVFVSGSEEQFAWLFKQKKNGTKGGRPKQDNPEKPTANPEKPMGLKNEENETQANPRKPSYSYSISPSSSDSFFMGPAEAKASPPHTKPPDTEIKPDPPPSSPQLFENYLTEEARLVREFLARNHLDRRLKRLVPQIIEVFETAKGFRAWAEEQGTFFEKTNPRCTDLQFQDYIVRVTRQEIQRVMEVQSVSG